MIPVRENSEVVIIYPDKWLKFGDLGGFLRCQTAIVSNGKSWTDFFEDLPVSWIVGRVPQVVPRYEPKLGLQIGHIIYHGRYGWDVTDNGWRYVTGA